MVYRYLQRQFVEQLRQDGLLRINPLHFYRSLDDAGSVNLTASESLNAKQIWLGRERFSTSGDGDSQQRGPQQDATYTISFLVDDGASSRSWIGRSKVTLSA